jgi:coenzyme F420-reducing hydrogenase delta subunit
MFNLSSAMGPRFAEIATEITDQTKAIGPSPLNGDVAPTRAA